ncbi:Satratoxin biosynthesis SC1 cluster protein 4 [Colletotrichum sp. SAR11_239]|nr:Satratoxin biosynthesis SC1 cluster protein 4 [Colletotrichum sp. SAR 10_77]KAI8250468.1 Satratoxin biosynthesis SC1 cluster protein 4 [Colletotrichum sp. SAR11_239]
MAKLPADSYEDQRGVVIGSVVFCIMFPTTLVGLRIYTRTKVIELFGIDDVLAIAGLTFFVSIVFYNIALLCIKLSFLFQYYRIMAVPKMRRIYAVAIVVVGAWAVSQLLIATFTCIPVEGFWDKTIKAYCIPNQPQWKQKLLLMGIFSLGFFTVAVSIVRTKYLSIQQDFTWTNVEASLWSLGEISSAVTCACLPTLRPLMTKLFPRMMARVNYSLHSDTRGTRDTRGTFPTSAYPPAIVKPDVEMATTESAVSSARSSHAKEDKSATHVSPYSNQHRTASTESIFGLASVREDAITPVKSNFSPTSPRPTWSPSSSKGSQGRREIRRNGSVI